MPEFKQYFEESGTWDLDLDNFDYDLPENRIAQFPLDRREGSKLLFYKKGNISHTIFKDLPGLLDKKFHFVFNETRVIPARLIFRKKTGALIEILLLNPVYPSSSMPVVMNATDKVTWKCMIRNFRKWADDITLEANVPHPGNLLLKADIKDRKKNLITFSWNDNSLSFSEILEYAGKIPLPPYMKRETVAEDSVRYQTVYSRNRGAVAAPTAGLHFTDEIILDLKKKGHSTDFLTLHVGAGTFQPIKEKNIRDHPMHSEQILIREQNIMNLLEHEGKIIAVGTTSMRTLESLYWFGVKLLRGEEENFMIEKLYPYRFSESELPAVSESLLKVLSHMKKKNIQEITGQTGIFIFPGYDFKICKGLVTNYHVPRSTLILLVAAFVGENWRNIYHEALSNNYRFLSYGDSSLLLP